MRDKQYKDSFVIGFALFAMFFGAGNLIFPPYLGHQVGDQLVFALLGFLLTGVGLPLLGLIACAKIDGTFEKMANVVSPLFSKIMMIALTITLGPLVAIPRTAATTFELGVVTLLPQMSQLVTIIIYFGVALMFVLRPTSIVDRIGKILTPVLLLVLITIITKGVVTPIGDAVPTEAVNVFSSAFIEGYQTMDAMASVIFASIIMSFVHAKGYRRGKSATRIVIQAGIIATIGLGLVYGGLMVLGTQTSSFDVSAYSRTALMLHISQSILGNIGTVLLSVSVTLACLTTAVALLTSSATFFTNLLQEKVPYSMIATVLTVLSAMVALNDVDEIITLAAPVLEVLYPVVIVLILMTLLGKLVVNKIIVQSTVYTAFLISLCVTFIKSESSSVFGSILARLPFYEQGFAWVIPTLSMFIIMTLLQRNRPNRKKNIRYKM